MANRIVLLSAFLLVGFNLKNCEQQMDEELSFNDQDFYKLHISPKNPGSEDQILLIENTCGIEPEPILSYKGMQIIYKRYFNSLMGAPCRPTLDTTIIGPLNSGSYELVHWVIDKNHLLKDSIISVDTIAFVVTD
ncbi:MAG: hypothetical protein E4H10_07615 [Bacteroidia bacterium]|nr:MAG: hypothetical protein E4H10_07615 [Bacteroidia bacterium]